jgi:hypothetical protein
MIHVVLKKGTETLLSQGFFPSSKMSPGIVLSDGTRVVVSPSKVLVVLPEREVGPK